MTGNRTPNSGVKGSGANHYPRAPAPFGLINLVKNSTCFKSDSPSLLDVILTNGPGCFQYTGTILDRVSDFHATVVTTQKSQTIIPTTKILRSRSYKHFIKQIFIEDLERNNMRTCTNLTKHKCSMEIIL